jgi:hypothetical protein
MPGSIFDLTGRLFEDPVHFDKIPVNSIAQLSLLDRLTNAVAGRSLVTTLHGLDVHVALYIQLHLSSRPDSNRFP